MRPSNRSPQTKCSLLAFCAVILPTIFLSLSSTSVLAQEQGFEDSAKLEVAQSEHQPVKTEDAELLAQSATPAPNPSIPESTAREKPGSLDEPESRVLIAEVVVKGVKRGLQDEVYKAVQTQPGRTTTRSQLQEDINAIFATGYFSNVKAIPEDTPLGVRVTFEVVSNPILKSVKVKNATVLPQQVSKAAFANQYGKILNLNRFQEGIKKINKWYQDEGYVLAQVIDKPEVDKNGTVTIDIAEGVIEKIKIRFLNKQFNDLECVKDNKGEFTLKPVNQSGTSIYSVNGKPLPSCRNQTSERIITQRIKSKPGEVFNRKKIEKDLIRVFELGLFEDVSLSLEPDISNPRKVVVIQSIVERSAASVSASGGVSSKGIYSSNIELNRGLVDIALQTNDKNVIDNLDEFDSLHYQAKKLSYSSDLELKSKAIELYEELVRLSETKQRPEKGFEALIEIGNIYQSIDTIEQVIEFRGKALSFVDKHAQALQKSGYFGESLESSVGLLILPSLSSAYQSLGEYQQALIYTKQLQLINTRALSKNSNDLDSDLLSFAESILNSGRDAIYYDLGEKDFLQENFEKISKDLVNYSRKQTSQADKDQREIMAYSQLFNLLPLLLREDDKNVIIGMLNDFLKILEPIQKKLSQEVQLDNPFIIFNAILFDTIGVKYREVGQNEEALNMLYRALQIHRKFEQPRPQSKPSSLSKVIDAQKAYYKSLAQSFKANTLREIGTTLVSLNRRVEAVDSYRKALKLYQNQNDKSSQALTLVEICKVQRSLKQYQHALESCNQALSILQQFRNLVEEAKTRLEIAKTERARNNLVKAKTQVEAAIQLIETEPPPVESEQASPLSTQKQFKSYISLASYFSAKHYFYDFYVDLLMQLHRQNSAQNYLMQALQVSEQSRGRSLLAILKRRDRYVASNKNSVDTNKVQDLDQAQRIVELQKQLLDDNTVLLEYALGEERSYLWVVSRTGIKSYELPKRTDIEASARRFNDFLTVPSLRIRSAKSAKAAQELSQMILGDAANQLKDKRLIIVADGILQYIPFNALPSPNSKDQGANEPLITQHEVVMLPSASIFAALKKTPRLISPPEKMIAIFADPVFGYGDDRWTGKSSQLELTQKASLFVTSNGSSKEVLSEQLFPRISNTQIEAEAISKLIQPNEQFMKVGFAASRQAVLDPSIGQYRILHFSTHGILDAERPERSGMLLSVIDQQGGLQRSLLSTPDTFNLNLTADLVVLSGCRTGLGKDIKGEGLIGLTGGLMYAGARRVVVSLWSVDDQATAALMSHFYKGVLQEKLPPAQALRNAQLEIRKNPRWQSPFYWAGFILQGEWK